MQNWKILLLGEVYKISIMKINLRKLFVPSKSVGNTVPEDGRIATQTFLESKSNDLKNNGFTGSCQWIFFQKLISLKV